MPVQLLGTFMQVIYNCNSDKHNTYALVVQCTKLTLHLPFSRKVIKKNVLSPTWIKTVRCLTSTTRSTYGLFWSSVQISCIRIVIAGSYCIEIWKNNQVFTISLKGTVFWSNLIIASLVYLIIDLSLTAPVREPDSISHTEGWQLSDAMVVVKVFLLPGLELLVFSCTEIVSGTLTSLFWVLSNVILSAQHYIQSWVGLYNMPEVPDRGRLSL